MSLEPDKRGRTFLRQVVDGYRRHRFAILFYSLMATLGVNPLLGAAGLETDLIEAFLAVNLLIAVLGEAFRPGLRWLLLLAVIPIVARLIGLASGTQALLPFSFLLWSIVCMLAVVTTLRHALGAGPVNAERIYAALSAYVLAGLAFGVVYWILEQTAPGALAVSSTRPHSLGGTLYFSFVTLATLGYGDIVPVSEAASWLAILEAMGGQMYLTVLVARLVSLYAAAGREDRT